MHELGLVQNVLNVALAEAQKQGASRITSIRLRVGEMAHVSPESLSFYVDMLGRGTLAEGVRLETEIVPVQARCRACQNVFRPIDGYDLRCPACQNGVGEVLAGKEVTVESLEVE